MYTAEARVGWLPRLGIALVLGLLFTQLSLNSNIEQVAINCLIYAILAVGLNIAVGWAGLLDLGYIAFFGFGAYGYALLSSGNIHWSAIASIPVVFVGTAVFGAVIGLVSLRVLGDYLAIVTLFVGQAFSRSRTTSLPGTLGGVNGLFGLDPIHGLRPPDHHPQGLLLLRAGGPGRARWAYCTSSTGRGRAEAGARCARTSSPPGR